ncbi:MAG: RluA family pseudouridine synthase [Acidobacteriota bacterium]
MNRGCVHHETIDVTAAGSTVLEHLARRWPEDDVTTWPSRLTAGEIELAGRRLREDETLRAGQRLSWHRPPWEEPPVPPGLPILHHDERLVVVDKPSGLPTLPGAGYHENTVLHRLRERFPEASPVHRLGRATSGLVLCAREAAARRELSELLRSSTLEKIYRALVVGRPSWDEHREEHPIGPVPHDVLDRVHAASSDGKPAVTELRVLERREETALLEARLVTGRPHQIRIHVAACGHPLVGDPLYGAGGRPLDGTTAVPGDPGYLLHAWRIRLPASGRHPARELTSPPPEVLRMSGEVTEC